MKRWTPVLAVGAVLWAVAAAAAYHSDEDIGSVRTEVLTPDTSEHPEPVRLKIVQVFFPGLGDRFSCRMQVRAINQGASKVNFSALLKTFGEDKAALDSWLIPMGDLKPGQEVLRTMSCHQAASIEVSRDTEYGWPAKCQIDGRLSSPCPIELHVSTSVPLPSEKKDKKGKE